MFSLYKFYILGAGILLFAIICLYICNGRTKYIDTYQSIQRSQEYNKQARDEVERAGRKLEYAESELKRATETTENITETTEDVKRTVDQNAVIIKGEQDIIDSSREDIKKARRIFESVDYANRIP